MLTYFMAQLDSEKRSVVESRATASFNRFRKKIKVRAKSRGWPVS
jgi:hypothetical protein